MKIPENKLITINKKRNRDFKTKIDKKDIFNRNNMSQEAFDLLFYLDYNYWMDEEKKKKLRK